MSLARSPDLGNSNIGEAASDGFMTVFAGWLELLGEDAAWAA